MMFTVTKEELHWFLGVEPNYYSMVQMLKMLSKTANWSMDSLGNIVGEYSKDKVYKPCIYIYRIALLNPAGKLGIKDIKYFSNNYDWVKKKFDAGEWMHQFKDKKYNPEIEFCEPTDNFFGYLPYSELWNKDVVGGKLKLYNKFTTMDEKKYRELLEFYYNLTISFPKSKFEIYQNDIGRISVRVLTGEEITLDGTWSYVQSELTRTRLSSADA